MVVNGAPTQNDMLHGRAGRQPGRVLFNRTNLITFSIDLSAERLTVNGLGGNDSVRQRRGRAARASPGAPA